MLQMHIASRLERVGPTSVIEDSGFFSALPAVDLDVSLELKLLWLKVFVDCDKAAFLTLLVVAVAVLPTACLLAWIFEMFRFVRIGFSPRLASDEVRRFCAREGGRRQAG